MYMKCIYSMSVPGQTELHTKMQIKWFVEIIRYWALLQSTLGDLVYSSSWETFHCLRMRLQIPLQKRLQNAVLYNQRTSIWLTDFAVHPCFLCTYMFDCKFGAILPLATGPRAAVLSCFISTLRTPTAVSFGLPPGLPPADLTLYYNRWQWLGLCLQHFSWSSPARQAECGKQYYCRNARAYQELGGGGGVDVRLFVVLFGLVGFVVVWFLLLLLYFTLENAEELERAVQFAGTHFTVFAGDDWLQMACCPCLHVGHSPAKGDMKGSMCAEVLPRCSACLFWRCPCSRPGGQQSVCVRARDGAQPSRLHSFQFLASVSEWDMGDFNEKLLFMIFVYSELTVVFYYCLFWKRRTVIYIPFQLDRI